MTVKSLIAALRKEDPSRLVVLWQFPAGDGLQVGKLQRGAFNPRTHETGLEELDKEAIALGYTEEDVVPNGRPALLVYPR